ncbi:MAG TPA: heterodisulfide reductase-related iron-sulfur binding cluster [Methylomirabilota bacterium]|nr:heterodisulfide reductase-related iron-sulfur binding cluster [Methylomirabilota bacterium]
MTTFDIRAPEFWSRPALDTELRRVFDVCNGCRRCLPLCPSFKDLMASLDREEVDGDAERLPGADTQRVVDLCYQCKLCYNHCPYTPPHRWMIDFPRVMLRARAVQVRERGGVTLQDRVLGNTDLVGRLGTAVAPLANWASQNRAHRAFMQAVLGIHQDRNLPRFHRETFSRWFAAHREPAPEPVTARVALFATCPVEYHNPAVGRATVAVLRHNRVDVTLPSQRCCGMPYLDGGAVGEAQRLIDDNVRSLGEAVREGRELVVPGPTCSYMMKQEWPWLATDGETARLVAERTRDLFEFLARLHQGGRLDTAFPLRPGRVAYQLPCHLRAQNMGTKSADVLRLTGADVTVIERCSAVDGTWGFKREYYQLSMKVAEPLFRDLGAARPERTATDCPLAGLQIAQGTGQRPRHPIQILAEAYGLPWE